MILIYQDQDLHSLLSERSFKKSLQHRPYESGSFFHRIQENNKLLHITVFDNIEYETKQYDILGNFTYACILHL